MGIVKPYVATPQDALLRHEIKRLTPYMREKLLQHAAGPLPYKADANPRCTIAALERRRLIFRSADGKRTIPTAKAAAMIEIMRDDAMQEPDSAPLVPEATQRERETA